jgi:Flp pilus assembly protein TadD
LTIRLAEWLADAGLGGAAVALMRKAEPALNGSAAYWAQRTTAAGMANDLDDMLESSRRALELGRDDRRLRNNRAVALLLARRDPAEAVRLTFQNVTLFPGERPYQVNHALALLDNDRVLEARRILEGLAVAGMSSGQEANFHLAWVALLVREGRRAEATLRAGEVNRSQLLPVQEAWLDRMVAGVGKR